MSNIANVADAVAAARTTRDKALAKLEAERSEKLSELSERERGQLTAIDELAEQAKDRVRKGVRDERTAFEDAHRRLTAVATDSYNDAMTAAVETVTVNDIVGDDTSES